MSISLSSNFNRIGYGIMVLCGIVFLSIGNLSNASIYLGLAFIFDPFDATIAWPKRPVWQRAWTVAHLVAVLVIMVAEWVPWQQLSAT